MEALAQKEDMNVQSEITEEIPAVDPELERRVSRKFDMYLLPQIAILIICAYLDRTNIGMCSFNTNLTLRLHEADG